MQGSLCFWQKAEMRQLSKQARGCSCCQEAGSNLTGLTLYDITLMSEIPKAEGAEGVEGAESCPKAAAPGGWVSYSWTAFASALSAFEALTTHADAFVSATSGALH